MAIPESFVKILIQEIENQKKLNDIQKKIIDFICSEEEYKTVKEITESLKLKSSAATQKQLVTIYEALGINHESDKGPGKLHRLYRKIYLLSEEMHRKKRILLLWQGNDEQRIAERLKDILFSPDNVETIDLIELPAQIEQVSLKYDCAVMILLSSNPYEELFHLGCLSPRFEKCIMMSTLPTSRFEGVVSLNINRENILIELANEILPNPDFLDRIKAKQQPWKDFLLELTQLLQVSNESSLVHQNSCHLPNNSCFQAILSYYNASVEVRTKEITESSIFMLPTLLYNEFIYSLQKETKRTDYGSVCTQSTSFLDTSEEIWLSTIGEKILETTNESSVRVFIYQNSEELKRNLSLLEKHAMKYSVYIMRQSSFFRTFRAINQVSGFQVRDHQVRDESFVIIDYNDSKVVGTNVQEVDSDFFYSSVMCFYPMDEVVNIYQDWMNLLMNDHDAVLLPQQLEFARATLEDVVLKEEQYEREHKGLGIRVRGS